jgi:hypothetical protein
MKIFITIVVTAIVTWMIAGVLNSVQKGADKLWLVSAIKAPGRMALQDIQADLNSEHYELAKAKVDVLVQTWQRFDSGPDSFRGLGIGDVMVAFSKLETNSTATSITEPNQLKN